MYPHSHRRVDYTNSLPDECLALIFNFLTTTNDRNNSSLVSHRWLRIDAQTRTHLTLNTQTRTHHSLNAHANIQLFIPSIFTRFKSLTQLVLHCDPYSSYINDHGLTLIAFRCPNLTRLKLRACANITHKGMAILSQNCRKLKKFSCSLCDFGAKGIIALLDHSSSLEELSVKRLGFTNPKYLLPIGPGDAASSLKVICVKNFIHFDGRLFEPLIIGSKNLKTLKLYTVSGNWDRCLEMITLSHNSLVEVHLGDIKVSDIGLFSLSKCFNLQVLHIHVYLGYFTNRGLISFAENCKGLKKLYIDNRPFKMIRSECLIAIAEYCLNLEELVLIGVDACCISLEVIAVNCWKLERLDLCLSNKITDVEISYIAEKCSALKKLLIKQCCVSNKGVEAFALGCPNLVEIRVTMCENVTHEVKDRLRARRGSLVVKLDEVTTKAVNAVIGDSGVQEHVAEVPPAARHVAVTDHVSTSSN